MATRHSNEYDKPNRQRNEKGKEIKEKCLTTNKRTRHTILYRLPASEIKSTDLTTNNIQMQSCLATLYIILLLLWR